MRPSALRLTALATVLVAASLPANALAADYFSDPLTDSSFAGRGSRGGAFSANGWTTTGYDDTLWYEIPDALESADIEYTVTGLQLGVTLTGADHDLLAVYQAPDGVGEPCPYMPYFRNNDMKIFTRIFGDAETARPGAFKIELAACMMGPPYYDNGCGAGCPSIFGQVYANGSPVNVGWDGSQSYRMALSWRPGQISFSRNGQVLGSDTFSGTYAPQPLRVRIGSPRHSASDPLVAMPKGLTFRDVVIRGTPGTRTPACAAPTPPDAGTPVPPDAGAPAATDAGACLKAVSLAPAAGRGDSQTFRAVYEHCSGASAFRIVQLWVGDQVAVGVPNVQASYGEGVFALGTGTCTPGAATVLTSALGSLDCARSTVTSSGDRLTVEYAMRFDATAFAGAHGLFFDAKGPAGPNEPRLGWTRMGTFTVEASAADAGAAPAADAGAAPADAATPLPPADAGAVPTAADGGAFDAGLARDGGAVLEELPGSGACGCGTEVAPMGWLAVLCAAALKRRRG